jgi:hypothetical protein
VYRFGEEVCLACRVWWVGAMPGERVRQGKGSAKAAAVTVTTPTGHVSTVAVSIVPLAGARCVDGSLRSLHVRRRAAVFVGPDETIG